MQRFETPAGFQGQVGYATFNLPWGRRYALVGVLGYSRLLWLQFFLRQNMQTLFSGLESAFNAFGGVPQELLFDQMRAVVIGDDRLSNGALVDNVQRYWIFRVIHVGSGPLWIVLNLVLFAFGRVLNPKSGSATAAQLQYFRSSTYCSLADLGQS